MCGRRWRPAYPQLVSSASPRAARHVALLRRFRLPLAIFLVAWLLGPPWLRDLVPLWLAFVVALALEAQFFVGNYRSAEPFFAAPDRRPGREDRERYGTGHEADWRIVDVEGEQVWVDLAEAEHADETLPERPRSRRRFVRPLAEAAVVLGLVAALLLVFDRGSWEELSSDERRMAEARFSAEAARIAGKPVHLSCDTSGRIVGAVQHTDGLAVVGGDRAYITPALCFQLYRLAFDGDVPSFSQTARAIAVLAHEAWHLRGVRDEGITECYALQSGVRIGTRLGLDEADARRMMRSQRVANELHRQGSSEYLLPADCRNRGPLDLRPGLDLFP
jgi:hypothetical protein